VTRHAFEHEFVEHFPDRAEDGIIYISITFATAMHRCCCGCGNQVITPLSPNGWTLIFNGKTISLEPSIGNWSFPCQSHYWIIRNRVEWARRWSRDEIAAGRASEDRAGQRSHVTTAPARNDETRRKKPAKHWWHKLTMWF
jgi:hypothetical protein